LSFNADVSQALSITCAANGNPDATLVRRWMRHKLSGTGADGLPVLDGAKCVWSASAVARTGAPSSKTNGIRWTVLVSSGTKSFRVAAVRKRVADKSWRALADVSGRTGRLADCRGMARVGVADSTWDALDLRKRISSVSRRTLALGLVVLSNADGVLSARVAVADIVASVVEAIAELVGGTVDVVHARHLFAARIGIVGVSGKESWRTLATGDVVVDHADRLRSALDTQAR